MDTEESRPFRTGPERRSLPRRGPTGLSGRGGRAAEAPPGPGRAAPQRPVHRLPGTGGLSTSVARKGFHRRTRGPAGPGGGRGGGGGGASSARGDVLHGALTRHLAGRARLTGPDLAGALRAAARVASRASASFGTRAWTRDT